MSLKITYRPLKITVRPLGGSLGRRIYDPTHPPSCCSWDAELVAMVTVYGGFLFYFIPWHTLPAPPPADDFPVGHLELVPDKMMYCLWIERMLTKTSAAYCVLRTENIFGRRRRSSPKFPADFFHPQVRCGAEILAATVQNTRQEGANIPAARPVRPCSAIWCT